MTQILARSAGNYFNVPPPFSSAPPLQGALRTPGWAQRFAVKLCDKELCSHAIVHYITTRRLYCVE